jgi:hypothetical protein
VNPDPDSVAKPPGLQESPANPLAVLDIVITLAAPAMPTALSST